MFHRRTHNAPTPLVKSRLWVSHQISLGITPFSVQPNECSQTPLLRSCWGHPLLLGNITGDCTGDERLCNFLRQYRREITYSAPERTGIFGLGYVAWGEAFGFDSPIKAGLRTAMILSHMAAQAEDPSYSPR